MPLILCPECRRPISDQAVACPQCGFPVQNRQAVSAVPAVVPPPVAVRAPPLPQPEAVVPKIEANLEPHEPSRLQQIAYRQKLLLYALLIAILCQYPIWYFAQFLWLLPLGFAIYLASTAFGVWSFYKLGQALALPIPLLYFLAIGLFIPCIALGVMYIVIQRATRVLQEAGVRVGLLGADLAKVP